MIDRTGEVYGFLTALRRDPRGIRSTYWVFRCQCGVELVRDIGNVRRNRINGCQSCRSGSAAPGWRGCGDISQNVFRTIWHSSQQKQWEFSITIEYLWELFLSQDKKCAFTGWPISFNDTYNRRKTKTASLDRIDSTLGYVPGNVQWVHREVNKLKKNLTDERFIELCIAVAKGAELKQSAQGHD
jgi:hypothetical protein